MQAKAPPKRTTAPAGGDQDANVLADLEAGEDAIPLAEVRDQTFCPKRRGKKLDRSVVFRWASRGVRGIKLETTSAGGLRITTKSAVLRFFHGLNGGAASSPIPTTKSKTANVDRAARELATMGMK
jgi:hypothetical protein